MDEELQSIEIFPGPLVVEALETLIPGFGMDLNDLVYHIVLSWLQQNMGNEWMKEKGLIR